MPIMNTSLRNTVSESGFVQSLPLGTVYVELLISDQCIRAEKLYSGHLKLNEKDREQKIKYTRWETIMLWESRY